MDNIKLLKDWYYQRVMNGWRLCGQRVSDDKHIGTSRIVRFEDGIFHTFSGSQYKVVSDMQSGMAEYYRCMGYPVPTKDNPANGKDFTFIEEKEDTDGLR